MNKKTICFDLEGPLSPQDNAYEVMKLIGAEGASIFEVISRYDDIISLDEREGYEPGDTLALIVPFFLLHDITEYDIARVSARAKIVRGAEYLFKRLHAEDWDIYIISTSYAQHAYNIGNKLGVSEDHIICTNCSFDFEKKKKALAKKYLHTVKKAEEDILALTLYSEIESENTKQERIVKRLDDFFFQQLPALGFDIFTTRVMGGERKAEAIRAIVQEKDIALHDLIVVGDSITDYKMLKEVATHGGVAVVFNGNEYAIPYANVGLASADIRSLYLVCDAFERGGKRKVMDVVRNWEDDQRDLEDDPANMNLSISYFHNLEDADQRRREEIIKIHKQFRMQVREDAGKLG